MHFAFDLISDLHVETWDKFNWVGQPTSPYCVVAGDVSRDPEITMETLEHLGQQYAGVFYIDGNDEHRYYLDDLGSSYRLLDEAINGLKNVVYMQDNVVIINGVAILATNGWWTYDFNPKFTPDESIAWYQDYVQISNSSANAITGVAYHDAAYIINSVSKLQKQQDVKSIVIVSHTVPAPWIINHDIDFSDYIGINGMGNRHIQRALDEDTENKVKAWCFGHYHKSVDRDFAGIRYVSNPRGRDGPGQWHQNPYFPKRIEIEI
jgi:hypothetical protein